MKKPSEKTIMKVKSALIFVLGVIVTVVITKASDKIVPDEPVVVKEYTDTIKVVHDYILPVGLNDDSTRLELEKKVKNLELLNTYDKQIKDRLASTKRSDGIVPNLIVTNKGTKLKKGFTYGSSSSFFSSECPSLDNQFLDLQIDFFNPETVKDIAYLRVNIYRYDNYESKEARTFVLEEFYEVKPTDNIIRISNDFPKGKYEILYGFIFKHQLSSEYPSFHFKKCVISKR